MLAMRQVLARSSKIPTTITTITLKRAQISINAPAPSKIVNVIFFRVLNPDFHSNGRGIDIIYKSVDTFKTKLLQISGVEMVG